MGCLQQRFDNWARLQRDRMAAVSPPLPQVLPWRWNWRWPWQGAGEQKQRLQEEYKRRREQIQHLCSALKAENVDDLQDVLSAVILSECVYKIPESELMRSLSKFKADFGEQLVRLERVQPSLDHVQHRYLLAEAGGTLFASFVGTKQYKDVIADANILQGALFHEDCDSHDLQGEDDAVAVSVNQVHPNYGKRQKELKLESSEKVKQRRLWPKPAAHRGFLARANGIPAVELYKLARKRNRRLVLCGHSLGGAVAVLAALAILRAFTSSKSRDRVQVKCITFSQPPVGNAALRDYVHHKGWNEHFRTYCIPEDVVPRILSPAYFQHYQMHSSELGSHLPNIDSTLTSPSHVELVGKTVARRPEMKSNEGEHLVHGLGPLQNSLWRISKLVPLAVVQKPFYRFRKKRTGSEDSSSAINSNLVRNEEGQSLKIQEGSETIALTPISLKTDVGTPYSEQDSGGGLTRRRSEVAVNWRSRVPSFPSYVPFGQLLFLGKSSVEPLSASEYTQLTSVQSVIMELRERFQSHTMRSYRARFQKVYDICMRDGNPPPFAMDHLPQLLHLQQWLGLRGAVTTQIGRIADPLIIHTATSLVPLGWSGFPREKKGCEPLLVDVQGYGLHLCTLVKVQVNGRWCSTTVESLPRPPPLEKEIHSEIPKLQKMRIRVGAPLQHSSLQKMNTRFVASTSAVAESLSGTERLPSSFSIHGEDRCNILRTGSCPVEGLGEVTIHCSSDFMTVSKEVVLRLRCVRLLGLEGAGKTSLFYALLGQGQGTTSSNSEGIFPSTEWQEGVAEGVAYIDPTGVNLQDLVSEVNQLKQELSFTGGHHKRKVDLVILVHNLSHKAPRLHQTTSSASEAKPALSLLMDEVAEVGIPFILAITNKYSVSADCCQVASHAVMDLYRVPSNFSIIVNSCPYVVHGISDATQSASLDEAEVNGRSFNSRVQGAAQKLISSPISLVQLPFRKKETVLPIEGIKNLHSLVHKILLSNEEAALEELAREQLFKTQSELTHAADQALQHDHTVFGSVAVGTIGAGFGLIIAVVTAAASSLRKP